MLSVTLQARIRFVDWLMKSELQKIQKEAVGFWMYVIPMFVTGKTERNTSVQSHLCLSADDWNKDFLVYSRFSVPSSTTVC
jgi:hypothetical protein